MVGLLFDRVDDPRRLVDSGEPVNDDHPPHESVGCSAPGEDFGEDQTRLPRICSAHKRVLADATKAIEPQLQPASGAHILARDDLLGEENNAQIADWQFGVGFYIGSGA